MTEPGLVLVVMLTGIAVVSAARTLHRLRHVPAVRMVRSVVVKDRIHE
jgi:hypothetical protein